MPEEENAQLRQQLENQRLALFKEVESLENRRTLRVRVDELPQDMLYEQYQ